MIEGFEYAGEGRLVCQIVIIVIIPAVVLVLGGGWMVVMYAVGILYDQ